MAVWRKILWPLVPLYALVTAIRNKLFDLGWLKSHGFEIPVIVVGNISTGGTGKTPCVEFLISQLPDLKIGFVSRGYGRSTKGLRIISPSDSPSEIGDEPWQIMNKFPQLKGAVSEKRVRGIEALLERYQLDVIILDDAFQHRYVKGDVNILLTTWSDPYYKDHLLPAGNLRESRGSVKRADIIIITKCPTDMDDKQKQSFLSSLNIQYQSTYFSSVRYGSLKSSTGKLWHDQGVEVVLLTGIANPLLLKEQVQSQFVLKSHLAYGDHHSFSPNDIKQLENSSLPIITTEKDWARLKPLVSDSLAKRIYVWPIEMHILFHQKAELVTEIRSKIHRYMS